MGYRRVLPLGILILLVGGFVWLSSFGFKQSPVVKTTSVNKQTSSTKETGKVLWVVDGDTVKVLINNKEDTVRLIGIDAPEMADTRKSVQCFGREASDEAKKILNGKIINLESDPTQADRDEYGRLLRYVFLDGLNFNQLMISEGFAREYTFKGKVYEYQAEFIQAEKEAREKNRGLWQKCAQD